MSSYNLSIFPPSLASSATCPTGNVGVTAIATAFQAKSIKKMGGQMQSICDNKITFKKLSIDQVVRIFYKKKYFYLLNQFCSNY
jgi:hypothetical protein